METNENLSMPVPVCKQDVKKASYPGDRIWGGGIFRNGNYYRHIYTGEYQLFYAHCV